MQEHYENDIDYVAMVRNKFHGFDVDIVARDDKFRFTLWHHNDEVMESLSRDYLYKFGVKTNNNEPKPVYDSAFGVSYGVVITDSDLDKHNIYASKMWTAARAIPYLFPDPDSIVISAEQIQRRIHASQQSFVERITNEDKGAAMIK